MDRLSAMLRVSGGDDEDGDEDGDDAMFADAD